MLGGMRENRPGGGLAFQSGCVIMQRGVTCDSALFGRRRAAGGSPFKRFEPQTGVVGWHSMRLEFAWYQEALGRTERMFVAIKVVQGDEQAEEGQ